MNRFREVLAAWWDARGVDALLLALFLMGVVSGWWLRGEEHLVAGRCHAPELVSITRDGGDLIVRCGR